MKNIFSKLCKNFDCTKAKYVNVDRNATYFILANNRICDFNDVNSKLFYKILLSQKTVKSYMEKYWCKTFECDLNWHLIYKQMIENIHIPIVSEFNYKLLHNLLGTRSLACKWDNTIDKYCVRCRDSEETSKHII